VPNCRIIESGNRTYIRSTIKREAAAVVKNEDVYKIKKSGCQIFFPQRDRLDTSEEVYSQS
jgi:hypothetical protein